MLCPAANTTLRTLVIDRGAWRPGFNPTVAKPCPIPHACIGGKTERKHYDRKSNETCAAGLRGAYCERCDDEWHYLDTAHAAHAVTAHVAAARVAATLAAAGEVAVAAVAVCRRRAGRARRR
jgi:hypothetical protein